MRLFFYVSIALSVLVSSCEKNEISTEVSVFTEEIVFTSGEQVIMTGRILALLP